MHTIITNAKGSRSIDISDEHIATIRRYNLLCGLAGTNGITERTVERLQLHVRSLLESITNDPDLLILCKEVIFHDNMKAIGLANLIELCKAHTDEMSENPE